MVPRTTAVPRRSASRSRAFCNRRPSAASTRNSKTWLLSLTALNMSAVRKISNEIQTTQQIDLFLHRVHSQGKMPFCYRRKRNSELGRGLEQCRTGNEVGDQRIGLLSTRDLCLRRRNVSQKSLPDFPHSYCGAWNGKKVLPNQTMW